MDGAEEDDVDEVEEEEPEEEEEVEAADKEPSDKKVQRPCEEQEGKVQTLFCSKHKCWLLLQYCHGAQEDDDDTQLRGEDPYAEKLDSTADMDKHILLSAPRLPEVMYPDQQSPQVLEVVEHTSR